MNFKVGMLVVDKGNPNMKWIIINSHNNHVYLQSLTYYLSNRVEGNWYLSHYYKVA